MKKAIIPVYQPIVDAKTGIVSHYEALARTINSTGEHGRLIELGELVGFIDLVDIAMLEHVVEALQKNPGVTVALNVSGVTIERSCNDILSAIFKNVEFMRRVVFEITETSDISDLRMLNRFLMSVRLLDARVALDDYGTGFCNMDMVRHVKPEYVKLDGEVVRYCDSTGDADAIREIVDLVHGYGGEVIAEHIDSQRKADTMRSLGVRYLQGYHMGEMVMELPKNEFCVVARGVEERIAVAG